MNKYLKWIAPMLVMAVLLASCGNPQHIQNDRDYDRGRNNGWVLLGERRTDSRNRTDAIYPRGRYNNFSQLRFTTTGRDVALYRANVVYDNGRRETVKLNMEGRNGASRTVNLRNRNGNIREIDLDYNSGGYGRRADQGSILVYGK